MPISKDDLQKLKNKHDQAKNAYLKFKGDGTIDGDIAERTLLHALTKAEGAYKDAIDAYVKEQNQ